MQIALKIEVRINTLLTTIYRAKLICFDSFLFFNEVGVLRNMFVSTKSLRKNFYLPTLHVMIIFIILIFFYVGHDSRRFINKLQNIINSKLKLTLKINLFCKIFKASV